MTVFTLADGLVNKSSDDLSVCSSSVKARRTSHLVLVILNLYEDGQTKHFECKGLGTSTGCLWSGYLASHCRHFDYPQNNNIFVSPTVL